MFDLTLPLLQFGKYKKLFGMELDNEFHSSDINKFVVSNFGSRDKIALENIMRTKPTWEKKLGPKTTPKTRERVQGK